MAKHKSATKMVPAPDVRDWLTWLCERYDPHLESPENTEIRRLGQTLEELARHAGALDTISTIRGTSHLETFGVGACLPSSFDWEHGEIDFNQPHLLSNRLGSPDAEALIARLVAVTGIPERPPPGAIEPDYVV
jgi:hypothetical protein